MFLLVLIWNKHLRDVRSNLQHCALLVVLEIFRYFKGSTGSFPDVSNLVRFLGDYWGIIQATQFFVPMWYQQLHLSSELRFAFNTFGLLEVGGSLLP